VTLSYAQSLDGSLTACPGRREPLSGPEALRLTHWLRASHAAILVGIGTVLIDDPRLTVRLVAGAHPRAVVVDSQLRTPPTANVLCRGRGHPWIATTAAASAERRARLEAAGARVLPLPATPGGQVDLAALLAWLAAEGITTLMVEGGARIITSFLAAGLVDQVVLTLAPRLLGGPRALGEVGAEARARLPRLASVRYTQLGGDLIVQAEVGR
jgi:riboflavin-specific deaminase-like protein